jgi:hypothetical protein
MVKLLGWHCDTVVSAGWRRHGCPGIAVAFWVDELGVCHGYCHTHRADGAEQAAWRRWTAQAGPRLVDGAQDMEDAA